jgi:hypothetical protein
MFDNSGHFLAKHLMDDFFLFNAPKKFFDAFVDALKSRRKWFCQGCRKFWARGANDNQKCNCGTENHLKKVSFRDLDVNKETHIRSIESVEYPGRNPGPIDFSVDATNDDVAIEDCHEWEYRPFSENNKVFQEIRYVGTSGTINGIPQRLAKQAIKPFIKLLKNVVSNPSNMDYHAALEQFPLLILGKIEWVGTSDRKTNQKFQQSKNYESLRSYKEGPGAIRSMWQDLLEKTHKFNLENKVAKPKPGKSGTAQKGENHKRCLKFLNEGFIGKACASLLSGGVADIHNDSTLLTIKSKFPSRPPASIVKDPPPALQVTQKAVKDALLSFPRASAGSVDGLKPQHLQDFYRFASEVDQEEFLGALTQFVNAALAGSFPSEYAEFFASANVIPLIKNNGDLRPIAIGSTMRRLIAKGAFRAILPEAMAFLSPFQTGVGIKGGCEATVHAFKRTVDQYIDNPQYVAGLADAVNAFNLVERQKFLDCVLDNFPGLYRFVAYSYAQPSKMYLGYSSFFCSAGVQQGDPLGPFLFCLAIHSLINKINSECPNLNFVAYYLDDGTFFGTIDEVKKALDILLLHGPEHGIVLNHDKTEIYCPGANALSEEDKRALFEKIPLFKWTTRGVKLLGGLIGTDEFIQEQTNLKIDKVQTLLDCILELKDPHVQLTLIRNCASSYKIGYLLRVCDSSSYREQLRRFDDLVTTALNSTLDTNLTKLERDVMGFKPSKGGLGLPSASSIAGALYIASRAQTGSIQASLLGLQIQFDLISLEELLEDLTITHKLEVALKLEDLDCPNPQSNLCNILDLSRINGTMNKLGPRQQKLFKARQSNEFVQWFNALPSRSLRQHIMPIQFRTAVKFQFGLKINESEEPCNCCTGTMDRYGAHGTLCGMSGGLTARHDKTRDAILELVRQSGYACEKERKELLDDGTDKRPADVFIQGWSLDQALALDVAVVNGADPNAIEKKEHEKKRKYLLACSENDLIFTPFVIDSFGRMGKSACQFIRKLSFKFAEKMIMEVAKAQSKLKLKVVQTMIREQSAQVIARKT